MKRCGHCHRLNRDEDLVCVICAHSLSDAQYEPDTDATGDWWRVCQRRRRRLWREAVSPSLLHAAVVGGTAVVMAFYSFRAAIPYFAAGGIVALTVCIGGVTGRFRLGILQAALSIGAVVWFGPMTAMTPFVIPAHIFSAMFLGVWVEMLDGMR